MAMRLILVFLYTLLFSVAVHGDSYCKYPNLQAYPAPHQYTPIDEDALNNNCISYPTFNASVIDGTLVVDCDNAQFSFGGTTTWLQYSSPVPLKKGQNVFVKCNDGNPVLLVKPPTVEDNLSTTSPSPNPSVFVVMVDAVALEVLHRLMPNTVNMLKSRSDMDVYEFTKYATMGINSNPNKFALFGRHSYYDLRNRGFENVNLSWIWEHAKTLGYTTVIAEDECPRHDSVWEVMNVHPFADPTSTNGPDFVLLSQMCVTDPHPNKYCVKNRWGFEYVVDYVMDMIHNFEKSDSKNPIFMWSNFIDAHEPEQWAAALMDDAVANYLNTIAKSRFMENGVLVFLSDHGLHFGDFAYSSILGASENKHPFMYVLAKKGVLNHDVLSKNQDKLFTPNDMYRTLSTLIGHAQQHDPRDIDIFSTYVPEERTCDMAGVYEEQCLCTYGPECAAAQTLPPRTWEKCVSLYAHPFLFDWTYYNEAVLKPKFGRDFTECEATMHWCAFGFAFGLNGTSHNSLRAYVARTPELASEFCWAWPNDCNWGSITEHYFHYGYTLDSYRNYV